MSFYNTQNIRFSSAGRNRIFTNLQVPLTDVPPGWLQYLRLSVADKLIHLYFVPITIKTKNQIPEITLGTIKKVSVSIYINNISDQNHPDGVEDNSYT